MTSIYNAIMKAADHIEKYPDEFNFWSLSLPDTPNCGTPGCALGWIACFANYKTNRINFGAVARDLLKVTHEGLDPDGDQAFYNRMTELCGSPEWELRAEECARVLRLYAAEYHMPSPTGIPSNVREIFTHPRHCVPSGVIINEGSK